MQNGSTTYGTTAGAMMVLLYNVVDYLLLVIKPQTKTRRLRQLLISPIPCNIMSFIITSTPLCVYL